MGNGGGSGQTDHTISFSIDTSFGTGGVTIDSGNGPVAVFDTDVITLPVDTVVTVTATGTNGSVVIYFEAPNYAGFAGNTTETTTFTLSADSFVIVEFG